MDAEIICQTRRSWQGHTGFAQCRQSAFGDDNLLDNQDLCLLFKVSIKTLQRYRALGVLPYFTFSGKVYYRASDVRELIKERFSSITLRKFEKEHSTDKK